MIARASLCYILHMSVITQGGWSALIQAASGGLIEVVVELVKAGADLNIQDNVCHNILHVFLRKVILCIIISSIQCHVYGKDMQF